MPRAEWRSQAAYDDLRSLDAPGFAWQFLNETSPSSATGRGWRERANTGPLPLSSSITSPSAGGCDFRAGETSEVLQPLWTAASLPSVIPISPLPLGLAGSDRKRNAVSLDPALAEDGPARLIRRRGALFRLHILEEPGKETPCVLLPLDQLFEVRAMAAIRLWSGLTGRSPGRNPAELPAARRERLILALRALDGRLEKASYRDIAETLFGSSRMPDGGWKTHDIRDRTVRLARLGISLMQGGYRHLLLYPYRGRT